MPPARLRVLRSQAGGEVLVEAAPPPRVQVKRGEVRQLRVGLLLVVLHARVLCKQSRVNSGLCTSLFVVLVVFPNVTLLHLELDRAPAVGHEVDDLLVLGAELGRVLYTRAPEAVLHLHRFKYNPGIHMSSWNTLHCSTRYLSTLDLLVLQ